MLRRTLTKELNSMPDVLSRYLVQLFGWKPLPAADIVGTF